LGSREFASKEKLTSLPRDGVVVFPPLQPHHRFSTALWPGERHTVPTAGVFSVPRFHNALTEGDGNHPIKLKFFGDSKTLTMGKDKYE
jgi:hypothetical protein